jgi:hypothetical protein
MPTLEIITYMIVFLIVTAYSYSTVTDFARFLG